MYGPVIENWACKIFVIITEYWAISQMWPAAADKSFNTLPDNRVFLVAVLCIFKNILFDNFHVAGTFYLQTFLHIWSKQ